MRLVAEGMGSYEEIAYRWSFDELAAAHRALWLRDQIKQFQIAKMIESIASGLKKGGKKGR